MAYSRPVANILTNAHLQALQATENNETKFIIKIRGNIMVGSVTSPSQETSGSDDSRKSIARRIVEAAKKGRTAVIEKHNLNNQNTTDNIINRYRTLGISTGTTNSNVLG